jgi:hypothetical protein
VLGGRTGFGEEHDHGLVGSPGKVTASDLRVSSPTSGWCRIFRPWLHSTTSRLAHPPLRLAVGADAVAGIRASLEARLAELGKTYT